MTANATGTVQAAGWASSAPGQPSIGLPSMVIDDRAAGEDATGDEPGHRAPVR